MSTVIRNRTPADLDECVRILQEVHESARYPVNWPADPAGWLTPPGTLGTWVLTIDGVIAGHLIVTGDGADDALVERLFVDPRRTRGGLGGRLLRHAMAFAADQGRRLTLDVVDNRQGAVDFYRRSGWRETGRTPIDWAGDQASALIRFEAPSVV